MYRKAEVQEYPRQQRAEPVSCEDFMAIQSRSKALKLINPENCVRWRIQEVDWVDDFGRT